MAARASRWKYARVHKTEDTRERTILLELHTTIDFSMRMFIFFFHLAAIKSLCHEIDKKKIVVPFNPAWEKSRWNEKESLLKDGLFGHARKIAATNAY